MCVCVCVCACACACVCVCDVIYENSGLINKGVKVFNV